MGAAQLDLLIPGGGTLEFVIDVIGGPAALDGYVGSMHIREVREAETPLAIVPPEGIVVNAGTRQVKVTIPSSETETYEWRRGVYDVRITGPAEDDWILAEGRATLKLAVTRED